MYAYIKIPIYVYVCMHICMSAFVTVSDDKCMHDMRMYLCLYTSNAHILGIRYKASEGVIENVVILHLVVAQELLLLL